MNFATDLAAFLTASYPDRSLTDPAKKTAQWIRQMAAAGIADFWRGREDWHLWALDTTIADNLRYAAGEQDTKQYRRFKGGDSGLTANSREVTNRDTDEPAGRGGTDPMGLDSVINAQPLPILPVKLRGLKALIREQRYEATITALGKKATKEAQDHEAEVRLWMDFGDMFKAHGQPPGPGLPDPMPATESELRTYLDDWQVGAAADLERKILICDTESDIDQLMDECADDILNHGYAGLHDNQQPGLRTATERILPGRGIFPPSPYPDYRDMRQCGLIKALNYDELRAEITNLKHTCNADGKQWTKDDWATLQQLAAKSLPSSMGDLDPQLGSRLDTGGIEVVRWYFRSDDLHVQKTYTDNSGNVRTRPQGAAYELAEGDKGKLTKTPVNYLYEATLVCGTGLAYNCRKVLDQGRDLHDPLKARMPVSVYSTPTVSGRPVSMVRNAKGIVDEMERAWRGYMADLRTYMPEGVNISKRALTEMADGIKGLNGDPMKALEYIKQTGDSFLDQDTDLPPGQAVTQPITKNPGGIPASAQVHLSNLMQQLQLLEAVTGANAVVSAQTPGTEAGKGTSQIALQGAQNVMAYARDGLRRLYENHARNLAGRIYATDAEIPVTGSAPGPDGQMKPVTKRTDFHEYLFHMKVELGPTQAEWQELYAAANAAVQANQITYADYMKLKWLRNLKTAQRYMAVAVERKARQDKQDALDLQKANGDVQTQTAQAAATAQQETDAKKGQLTMQELQYARETAWGTVERQVAGQDRSSERMAAAKIEATRIAELGHAARTDADNQHEQLTTTMRHDHERESMVQEAALAAPAAA